jgi:RNA polymerase sigma factor (sigma-70 family)
MVDNRAQEDRKLANLMRLAQDGNRAAYTQLLHEIVPLLRLAVRRKRGFLQPQDVDDLVQNILLALHSVRATYDPERPFLPWLMAVARNQIADGARRYARRLANEVAVERLPETFSPDAANMYTEAYRDPDKLLQAIAALPKGQRRSLELTKLREMSLKEAAMASGMSMVALKVSVHRAMRNLRKSLGAKA